MLDQIFFDEGYVKKKLDHMYFGFFVSIVGFFLALMVFGKDSSQAQIFMIAILAMPAVSKFFKEDDYVMEGFGIKDVFFRHKNIFLSFVFLFCGIFLGYMLAQLGVLSFTNSFDSIFGYQVNFVSHEGSLVSRMTDGFITGNYAYFSSVVYEIIKLSMLLIVFAFLLSFIYGSSGIFFMVIVASIFSTMIIYSIKTSGIFAGYSILSLVLMVFLLFPILLSTIAGGIVSKVIVKEGIKSSRLMDVITDALIIFVCSVVSLIALVYLWFLAVLIIY